MTLSSGLDISCDVLILGSGGAGLLAALHAARTNPRLRIILASKGLIGKSGCTRMVQGGYNAVLDPADSLDKHLTDTLEGGQFINHQELAYTLVRITNLVGETRRRDESRRGTHECVRHACRYRFLLNERYC